MPSFFVQPSPIHGRGLFTRNTISKGSRFYVIPPRTITAFPKIHNAFIGNGCYVDDVEVLNWVNHSCEPNTTLDVANAPALIASRDIAPGEEITCDYTKTEIGGTPTPCTCRTKACRSYFLRKNKTDRQKQSIF